MPTRPLSGLMLLGVVAACALLGSCGEPEPGEVAAARVSLSAADLAGARAVFAAPDPGRIKTALARVAASEPPIAWLLEGLLDPNRGVREWSAHALGDLAPQDDAVVRALMLSFEDDDDYVRWKAARALGNIGRRAKGALPLLRVAAQAKQEVEVVRAASQKAVRQIAGG